MEQHRIAIRKGLKDHELRHVAHCKTCGWMGQPQPTERAAERDGDGHVIAIS